MVVSSMGGACESSLGDGFERSSGCSTACDVRRVHEKVVSFATQSAKREFEEGELLLEAYAARTHFWLGFASFAEYVERFFGYNRRFATEKLRVARALTRLPELRGALQGGRLSWSVVRELTRVATAETERAWLVAAEGRSVRQVEELVSGRRPGDEPSTPADPQARRHVLRYEVNAETYALLREAFARLRRESGEALDDDAALSLMARTVLGGPGDEGRASIESLSRCARCAAGESSSVTESASRFGQRWWR